MTSETFDGYHGEKGIIFDDMNEKNGKILLPLLKNLINVKGYRFNVKFSTTFLYPEVHN